MNKDRLETFTDGVLAVAVTLLALDLKAPAEADLKRGLWQGIAEHWPTYAAYLVSFLIVSVIWISHNSVFSYIKAIDRPLVFLNMLLMMFVVAIPPATSLVGDQLKLHGHDARTAMAIFSVLMLAQGIAWQSVWWWAAGHPTLLADNVDPVKARKATIRFGIGIPVFAVAVAVSFANAYAGLIFQFVVAISYMFEQLQVQRESATA